MLNLRRRLEAMERESAARRSEHAASQRVNLAKRVITHDELRAAFERYCPSFAADAGAWVERYHAWGIGPARTNP